MSLTSRLDNIYQKKILLERSSNGFRRAEVDRIALAARKYLSDEKKTTLLKPTLSFPYHRCCNVALSCKRTPFPLETICESDTSEINTV